jgi:hypothetical protein
MVVSPSWDQSIQFGEDLQDIINATPLMDVLFESTKTTKMKLKNNSRLYLVSAGRGGISQLGKGVRYLGFDETQQIPEDVFVFLRPTLLGQKRGTDKFLVYAGTPLGRIGEFYQVYNKGKFYIKNDGIYEREYMSTETPGDFVVFERQTAVVNELNEVIDVGTNRVTVEEMIAEQNDMPSTGFLREYCLQFLDQIGEVFSKELVEARVDWDRSLEPRSEKKIVMGLDFGKHRYNSVLTIGELEKDSLKIINIIEWDLGTEYHKVMDDVASLQADYPNAISLLLDETGVGKGVIEIAERRLYDWRSLDVAGFDFSGPKKKKELVESGVTELEKDKVRLLYNSKLINEMLEFRREITDKNNIIYRKPQGGSDDYVDSLLLCIRAALELYDWSEEASPLVATNMRILNRSYGRVGRFVV